MKGRSVSPSVLLFMFILSLTSSCYALEIPENYTSEITALEFYPSGAKFTFSIDPQEDDSIQLYLPGGFNTESIRVVNPESVYGDVKVTRHARTQWVPPQLEGLKAQAEEQSELLNDLTARQTALEQTLNLLKSSTFNEARKPADLLTYIRDAQTLRLNTEKELALLKVEVVREREKLLMMNNELGTKRPRGDNNFIAVTGHAGGTVFIEAFTQFASWRPTYIMNMDTDTGNIRVQMFVRASQRTGLDYSGEVTLHTKAPDESLSAPALNPLRVSIKSREERVASTPLVSVTRTNKEAGASDDTAANTGDTPESVKEPAIVESIADRTVTIKGVITGDGTENEYAVIMDTLNLACKPVIMLVPERRNNAWIIASMDAENPHLIPGDAELRVDNHSSGKTYIEEDGASQRYVPFGYADLITIKKDSLIGKTRDVWFSGVFTSGYRLEVTNATKTDKTVTICDRIPVPTNENIKLDIKNIDPAQKTRDAENRLVWELNVPAGQTVPIIVDYTLSYPAGEELQYR